MNLVSPYDRVALKTKVFDAPDFGETWEEREAIAEKTANIDFGCDFEGNTCRAMREKAVAAAASRAVPDTASLKKSNRLR